MPENINLKNAVEHYNQVTMSSLWVVFTPRRVNGDSNLQICSNNTDVNLHIPRVRKFVGVKFTNPPKFTNRVCKLQPPTCWPGAVNFSGYSGGVIFHPCGVFAIALLADVVTFGANLVEPFACVIFHHSLSFRWHGAHIASTLYRERTVVQPRILQTFAGGAGQPPRVRLRLPLVARIIARILSFVTVQFFISHSPCSSSPHSQSAM